MSLAEACIAVLITTIAMTGSLTLLQSAWAQIIESRCLCVVLIQAQAVTDRVRASQRADIENVLLDARRTAKQALPEGNLTWRYNETDRTYQVIFHWVFKQTHPPRQFPITVALKA